MNFQGIGTCVANKLYIFVIFQGGGVRRDTPLDNTANALMYLLFTYFCREDYTKGVTEIYSVNTDFQGDKENTITETTTDTIYVNKGFEDEK